MDQTVTLVGLASSFQTTSTVATAVTESDASPPRKSPSGSAIPGQTVTIYVSDGSAPKPQAPAAREGGAPSGAMPRPMPKPGGRPRVANNPFSSNSGGGQRPPRPGGGRPGQGQGRPGPGQGVVHRVRQGEPHLRHLVHGQGQGPGQQTALHVQRSRPVREPDQGGAPRPRARPLPAHVRVHLTGTFSTVPMRMSLTFGILDRFKL